jgi:AcrR family transcriptional regulator
MLDAAVRLLKRGGAASITTNRIAQTAGVSIGSVYQYFPNKHALFVALHERHIRQVDAVMRRKVAASARASLESVVLALLEGMVEAHAADPKLAELLLSEVPHRAEASVEFSVRLRDTFLAALAPHAKSLGRRTDLRTRVFVMANMLDALGHALVLHRPRGLSLEAAKLEASKALLAYLAS